MNPKKTLLLASEYFGVLERLAIRSQAISLRSLRDALAARMPGDDRSARDVANLFSANGLLEASPEADGEWELPPAIAEFVLHLANRQRLLAPGMLRGLILDMGEEIDSLVRIVKSREIALLGGCTNRLIDFVQQAQKLSAEHHAAILVAVTSIKTREDKRSLRERYLFIQHLYEHHLQHMQQLVDTDGMLDQLLDRLLTITKDAGVLVDASAPYSTPLTRLRAHVLQLKRDSRKHFHESYSEVLPLYSQLRRDHELAAAAAQMLDVFGRAGKDAWNIEQALPIAYWTEELLFTDYALEDHLAGVRDYTADIPAPLITSDSPGVPHTPDPLYNEEIFERLQLESPIPDVLAWIFDTYPDQSETELLCVYQAITEHTTLRARHTTDPTSALFRGTTYTYYPLRIDHGSA